MPLHLFLLEQTLAVQPVVRIASPHEYAVQVRGDLEV